MTKIEFPDALRVLLVDDDEELCDLVGQYLGARGFVIESEGDGARGLERAQSGHYALLVLDVMLPSLDGLEVLRRLRAGKEAAARVPVVMLTAHGDEVDRIVGLELGADDYLSKPFNPRELLARIQAILRRVALEKGEAGAESARAEAPRSLLKVGDAEMDTGARVLRCGGEPLELTAMEFDLLAALLNAAGQVVTREELARGVLKRKLLAFDRSLDMHISKLRRKLGLNPNGAERIKTVRGIGYIYVTAGNDGG